MNAISDKINEQLLLAFARFEPFCKVLLDAFVLINSSGQILKSNTLFSQVVKKTGRQIKNANNLDELITFKIHGNQIAFSELVTYTNPTRIDEVEGSVLDADPLILILGIYPFLSDQGQVLGTFLLVRDVTAETNLQDKYKVKATQSITDTLTKLYNRAHFEQYLPALVTKVEQADESSSQRSLSILMSDIDHFKKINDKYGHPAGDYVIATVGKLLLKGFRKTDVLCRYGGEEFIVILPDTNLAGARTAAEHVRATIATHYFEFEGQHIPVTMSFGCAQLRVGEEKMANVIARADAALYFSKQNGRNRVSVHLEGERIE